jgi:hypothetical protein
MFCSTARSTDAGSIPGQVEGDLDDVTPAPGVHHMAQLAGEGVNTSGIRRVLDLEQRIVELADRPGSA